MHAARRVIEPRDDHLNMCIKAHNLAKIIAHQQPTNPKEVGQDHSDLYRVRHYIGRLSAWVRAARNVVVFGTQLSRILDHYRVSVVHPATPVPPVSLILGEDFEVLLDRMLPNFRNQAILSDISATVKITSGTTALVKGKTLELKPHAEAKILDHFSVNNLQFVYGDMYVACSRPSCYCCKLYFDHHPMRVSTGRHHKMLWI